jgi:pSer/pThr/pTyr-binding forkhead associated (FHA) protein
MRVTVKTSAGLVITKDLNLDKAIVGRSVKADVVVPDEALSRNHCLIEMEAGNFYITDLGSANGVFIDGERIASDTRTLYNSFSQLSIGQLECTIEDADAGNANQTKHINQQEGAEEKTVVRRVDKNVLKSPTRAKVKPVKSKPGSKINVYGVAATLIMAGAIYYQKSWSDQDKLSQIEDQKKMMEEAKKTKPPELKKTIPDEFKLPSEYQEFNSKKNCTEKPAFCANLKLETSSHEGLVLLSDEVVLFINPSKKTAEQKYQTVKDSKEVGDLIAMEMLLSSELLNQYVLGNISQIHMVLNSAEGIPYKVYRIHPTKFIPSVAPRIDMITALASAFGDGNTEKFWSLITPFIFTLTIQQ